jgi:hypothetical protein
MMALRCGRKRKWNAAPVRVLAKEVPTHARFFPSVSPQFLRGILFVRIACASMRRQLPASVLRLTRSVLAQQNGRSGTHPALSRLMNSGRRQVVVGSVLLVLLGSCAHARFDKMSAAEHRRAAAKERVAANEQMHSFHPDAQGQLHHGASHDPSDVPIVDIIPDYNPTAFHLMAAARDDEHAAAHERMAAEMEGFEDAACRPIPRAARAACPAVGPILAVSTIEGGVRLWFDSGAPVASIADRMRCHLAFAKARAFDIPSCPLTLPRAEIRVTSDGTEIDLTSRDRKTMRELRRRAAALVPRDR